MAIISGTAVNNNDFLDKLKAGLIANNWSLVVDQIVTTREMYFQNTSTNIIIGFKVSNIVGNTVGFSDIFPINIMMNSPTSYSSSFDWFNQVGSAPYYVKNTTSGLSSQTMPCFFSHDKNIYYNVFINDNRVVIVNNIAMKTVAGYIGKIKQYLSPLQHPNAVFIGGTNRVSDQFYATAETEARVSIFPFYQLRNEDGGNIYRDRNGVWKVIKTQSPNSISDTFQTPYFTVNSKYDGMLDNDDGSVTLVKINIVSPDGNVGELDDVFLTFTNLANNLDKTNDGFTIFNNFTKISRSDFFCVK